MAPLQSSWQVINIRNADNNFEASFAFLNKKFPNSASRPPRTEKSKLTTDHLHFLLPPAIQYFLPPTPVAVYLFKDLSLPEWPVAVEVIFLNHHHHQRPNRGQLNFRFREPFLQHWNLLIAIWKERICSGGGGGGRILLVGFRLRSAAGEPAQPAKCYKVHNLWRTE